MIDQEALPAHIDIDDIPTPTDVHQKSSRLKVLKDTLKNAFTKKAAIGYLKENWDTLLVTTAASGALKVAVFACSASFAASTSGIIGLAVAGGVLNVAVRHAYKLSKAEKGTERDKLRLTNAQFTQKLLMGAAMGGLFSSLGIGLGHAWTALRETCGGGPDGLKSFIVTHQANPVPAITDHAVAAQPPAIATGAPVATTPAPDATITASAHTASATPAPEAPVSTVTAAPAAAPDATILATPAPRVITSPLDAIKEYAANNNVNPKLKDALLRAESASPRIRAQALDDIAVYAPKSMQVQAHELLLKSASLGNLKAKADLITMEFYGNKALGIKANPEAAADKMVALSKHSKYAAKLVEDWLGKPFVPTNAPSVAPVAVPVAPSIPAITAPAPSVLEHFNTPADAVATQVAPVDVDTAPAAEKAYIAPKNCNMNIDVTDSSNMTMICDDNGADFPEVGEVITVQRPALLSVMAPR